MDGLQAVKAMVHEQITENEDLMDVHGGEVRLRYTLAQVNEEEAGDYIVYEDEVAGVDSSLYPLMEGTLAFSAYTFAPNADRAQEALKIVRTLLENTSAQTPGGEAKMLRIWWRRRMSVTTDDETVFRLDDIYGIRFWDQSTSVAVRNR